MLPTKPPCYAGLGPPKFYLSRECYIPVRFPHSTSVSFVLPFAIFPVKEIARQDDWINFSFSVTRKSMHYPEGNLSEEKWGAGGTVCP